MGINQDLPRPGGLFEHVIQFPYKMRFGCCSLSGLDCGQGVSSQKLPIDAVPDITNTQVQINTQAKGFTALEVEQLITYPLKMPWLAFGSETPVPYPVMDSLKSPLSSKMGRYLLGRQQINQRTQGESSCLHKSHRRCPPFLQVS